MEFPTLRATTRMVCFVCFISGLVDLFWGSTRSPFSFLFYLAGHPLSRAKDKCSPQLSQGLLINPHFIKRSRSMPSANHHVLGRMFLPIKIQGQCHFFWKSIWSEIGTRKKIHMNHTVQIHEIVCAVTCSVQSRHQIYF